MEKDEYYLGELASARMQDKMKWEAHICEICGKPTTSGELTTAGGYIVRLCTEHRRALHWWMGTNEIALELRVREARLQSNIFLGKEIKPVVKKLEQAKMKVFDKVETWLKEMQEASGVENGS